MVPTNTPFSTALSAPHKLIDDVLASSSSSSTTPTPPLPTPASIQSAFRRAFAERDALSKIPFLARGNSQARELQGKTVRWRGMVQDNSLGNEILPALLPESSRSSSGTRTSALYGGDSVRGQGEAQSHREAHTHTHTHTHTQSPDDASVSASASAGNAHLAERAVLFATSLPGRTPWAARADERCQSLAEGARTADAQTERTPMPAGEGASAPAPTPALSPRTRAKLPIPDEPAALGVLLKFYDLAQAEKLQVTDIVDVVGVLDRSPLPGAEGSAQSEDQEEELLPTLHVLFYEVLPDAWSDAKCSTTAVAAAAVASSPSLAGESAPARAAAIARLAAVLAGDEAAAEWVLLALIASVHTRRPPLALGRLSLRLVLPASASASSSSSDSPAATSTHTASLLYALLSSLVPSVAPPLPLTLPRLNSPSTSLAPRSTGDASGLSSGALQLPRGTLALFDERIAEGTLSAHGLQNLAALRALLRDGCLQYLFPYSPAPYALPADLPVLLVCERDEHGKVQGGLVPADVDVHVVPPASAASAASAASVDSAGSDTEGGGGGRVHSDAEAQAQAESVVVVAAAAAAAAAAIRTHLLLARRAARSLTLSEPVAEEIQRDFVRSRSRARASGSERAGSGASPAGASGSSSASGPASASAPSGASAEDTQETLLRRMDLARLLAASHLRTELLFADYEAAVRMDEGRVVRARARVGTRVGKGKAGDA